MTLEGDDLLSLLALHIGWQTPVHSFQIFWKTIMATIEFATKNFFSNLNRLKDESSQTDAAPTSRPTRVLGDHVLFKPNCIFCNSEKRKKVKIKGSWTTEGMSMFEMGGWKTVLQVAEHRNDEHLLRRIRGHDLFACEAKFHQSCRIKYVQDPTKWQSSNNKAKSKQPLTEHIHTMAFRKVCEKVNSEILENNNTLKRSELTAFYNLCLEDNGLENPD